MTSPIPPVRRRDGVRAENSEAGLVLIGVDGRSYALNPTAQALWELCDGDTTFEEIVEAVCEVSSTNREIIASDVRRLLHDLLALGLVDDLSVDRQPVGREGRC